MSGAGKQDQPRKRANENGSAKKPDKDQPPPENEGEKTLGALGANQLVPQPRYVFPAQDPDKELVQESAPDRLENSAYHEDLVRGEDGFLYPVVPYKSLKEKLWQEDQAEKLEAAQRQDDSSKSSSSSSSPPRESWPDDELQFAMDKV